MKQSPAFVQCLALAQRHISFEESQRWPAYMRVAALELFEEADRKENRSS